MKLSTALKVVLEGSPSAALSRAFGVLADRRLPRPIQGQVNRAYAKAMGIDVSESEHPPEAYPSLNAFFTRHLKTGVHKIEKDPGALLSPVDGKMSALGSIGKGDLFQAKGWSYRLDELLDHHPQSERFVDGSYMTLYLSPRDYHRIHAPTGGTVIGMSYSPGRLIPVNRLGLHNIPDLFAKNERLTTFIEMPDSRLIAVVKVGAFCVGRISVSYDGFETNRSKLLKGFRKSYDPQPEIGQGEELGVFNLGSTVVVLIQGQVEMSAAAKVGGQIRVGQLLARLL